MPSNILHVLNESIININMLLVCFVICSHFVLALSLWNNLSLSNGSLFLKILSLNLLHIGLVAQAGRTSIVVAMLGSWTAFFFIQCTDPLKKKTVGRLTLAFNQGEGVDCISYSALH